jgi:predicted nucleic acid-binding protein
MKVWDRDGKDIVRFVLTREQWRTLIEAIAGASVYARDDSRDKVWAAMGILRNAEEEVDASRMADALREILELVKRDGGLDRNDAFLIRLAAQAGLGELQPA